MDTWKACMALMKCGALWRCWFDSVDCCCWVLYSCWFSVQLSVIGGVVVNYSLCIHLILFSVLLQIFCSSVAWYIHIYDCYVTLVYWHFIYCLMFLFGTGVCFFVCFNLRCTLFNLDIAHLAFFLLMLYYICSIF